MSSAPLLFPETRPFRATCMGGFARPRHDCRRVQALLASEAATKSWGAGVAGCVSTVRGYIDAVMCLQLWPKTGVRPTPPARKGQVSRLRKLDLRSQHATTSPVARHKGSATVISVALLVLRRPSHLREWLSWLICAHIAARDAIPGSKSLSQVVRLVSCKDVLIGQNH